MYLKTTVMYMQCVIEYRIHWVAILIPCTSHLGIVPRCPKCVSVHIKLKSVAEHKRSGLYYVELAAIFMATDSWILGTTG